MEKYFRLKPEVQVEFDGSEMALYHLIDKTFVVLGKEYSKLLIEAEANKPIQDCELFESLKDRHMGDYYAQPVFIDKIRKYNTFSLRKLQKDKPILNTVIIQVTNDCANQCDSCGSAFCPVCLSIKDEAYTSNSSTIHANDWTQAIHQLVEYGAKNFILTGGDVFQYPYLEQLVDLLNELQVAVSLNCVSLPKKLLNNKVFYNIMLYKDTDIQDIDALFNAKRQDSSFGFITYEKALYEKLTGRYPIVLISKKEPALTADRFLPVDINVYFDKKVSDYCLNSKLTILFNGNVVPCLGSFNQVIGNIFEEELPILIQKVDTQFWKKGVNDETVYKKCASCIVRYTCPRCRFSTNLSNCMMEARRSK